MSEEGKLINEYEARGLTKKHLFDKYGSTDVRVSKCKFTPGQDAVFELSGSFKWGHSWFRRLFEQRKVFEIQVHAYTGEVVTLDFRYMMTTLE